MMKYQKADRPVKKTTDPLEDTVMGKATLCMKVQYKEQHHLRIATPCPS